MSEASNAQAAAPARLAVRLQQIRWEAEDIASYELAATDGAELPPFDAGAHVDLHLPGGMVRSYSLLNAPAERARYVIGVRHEREGRGGSQWMHRSLHIGDVLHISPPANDFALHEAAPMSVFIAGGIGITPILCMLERLEALGQPWRLYYASRSPAGTAFTQRLAELDRGRGWVQHCFATARARRMDIAAIAAAAPAQAHLYCCGPNAMIDDFERACAGRPAAQVHFERFAASQAAAVDGGYAVELRRSGQRLSIPAGKSILDTLLEHGIDVDYSCSSGICGSCRVAVLEGEPDHRDDCLSEAERRESRSIMVCCSGSRSPTLVLDL